MDDALPGHVSGGKYLNNWRMAELHAKEAPDRVRELERWGGIFDRTPSGEMSQRAFGGHTHRRLVHIGDRTGLELIRTLQDKGVHAGRRRLHGVHGHAPAEGRRPRLGRVRLLARDRRARPLPRAVVRARDRRHRQVLRGRPRTRGSAPATATRSPTRPAPSSSTWSSSSSTRPAWSGRRASRAARHRGRARRGRDPANANGERFMERYDPKRMELSTRDIVSRAIYTEVAEGRGSPRGGVYLDVSHLPRRDGEEEAAEHVRPVPRARRRRHHARADGGRADVPLHHGRDRGRRRDGRDRRSGLFAAGECAGGLYGATRLGGNSLSDLLVFGTRPAERPPRRRRGRRRRSQVDERRSPPARRARRVPRRGRRRPVRPPRRAAADDAGQRRHLPRRGRPDDGGRAIEELRAARGSAAAPVGGAPSTPAGTSAGTSGTLVAPRRSRAPRCARGEPRRAQPPRLPERPTTTGGGTTSSARKDGTAGARRRSRSSPCTSSSRSSTQRKAERR